MDQDILLAPAQELSINLDYLAVANWLVSKFSELERIAERQEPRYRVVQRDCQF